MHSILLIFLDGVGIGKKEPANPFFKYGFKTFTKLFGKIPTLENQKINKDNRFLFPTDPIMGVPGLPLSGTGQTSIFCGVNSSRILGKHFGPYPHSMLIPIIREQNIFKLFKEKKKKVTFANAYPKQFFDYIKSGDKRMTVTTLSCTLSQVPLKTATDLRNGNAVSAEIDNSIWVGKLGYKLPIIKPETAAKRLLKLVDENNFTLFEYFLTDYLGHGRNKETMEERLETLDKFLLYVFENISDNHTVVLCSDHGNLEDTSIKMHTTNPSLTITAGKYAEKLKNRITDISHIKDAILELY
ncbi:MAG: metalloenzyme [Ignavibacteriae bacterium]|nr:MAG: metalloenzyme [Ignavibacteriota bacterium]